MDSSFVSIGSVTHTMTQDDQSKSVVLAKCFEDRGYKTNVVEQAQRGTNQCNRNDQLIKRQKLKRNYQDFFSTRYSKAALKIK